MAGVSLLPTRRGVFTSAATSSAVSLFLVHLGAANSRATQPLQAHPKFLGIHVNGHPAAPAESCKAPRLGGSVAARTLPDEVYQAPRSCGAPVYPKRVLDTKLSEGGRFDQEQQQIFVGELRAAFKSLSVA